MSVEVHGLEQLAHDFPAWERRSERALGEMTVHVANVTRDVLALRVPVLTGRFRASSRVDRSLSDAGGPAARITEGAGIEYARWLEYGRRRRGKSSKGRYLAPTARRQKRLLKKSLADTTQAEIGRYPWPKGR